MELRQQLTEHTSYIPADIVSTSTGTRDIGSTAEGHVMKGLLHSRDASDVVVSCSFIVRLYMPSGFKDAICSRRCAQVHSSSCSSLNPM